MFASIETRFRAVAPAAAYCSLRAVHDYSEHLMVRRGVVEPIATAEDSGVMITVSANGGVGYAGTCDLTAAGLRRAAQQALAWARRTSGHTLVDLTCLGQQTVHGTYESPVRTVWSSVPRRDKVDRLRREAERLKTHDRIIDWEAGLWHTERETLFVTADGSRVHQHFHYLLPILAATANDAADTQTRTFGGHAYGRQGGLEVLEDVGFYDAAPNIADQALTVLAAPNCPSAIMDLVLAPDQMILQIHESIGHPLELDRILGDERNYAGTSFVTPDMFGTYRYGSELLNVTFDPTRPGELGSYAFDDDGQPAQREAIIRDGILIRPLGSTTSQARAGLPGVANARAISWNRPAIDRMAALNQEPDVSCFDDLIGAVDRGIYLETNRSWSIDDSRNKFQFGCEWGRLIDRGQLKTVVKNPNYRGVSATFWRSLQMVGDSATLRVLGTPYCGKGEPNQTMWTGHAAPACLFAAVDVFGGA